MVKRNRHERTATERLQRALLLPLVYLLLRPLLRLLERLGLAVPTWKLLSHVRHGVDPWPGFWKGYAASSRDVFVCSYLKSGTNWMLQIAQQIVWLGEAEFDHIHDVVPWPDEVTKGFAIGLEDRTADESPTGRRVIKTHSPWGAIPKASGARYILVVRDPKDVFVSSYYFMRGAAAGPLMPSVAAWYEMFLSPEFPAGRWPEHAHSYWAARNEPNVLFLTYKEMKADLEKAVRQVAEFLEVPLTPAQLARVCEKCSFDYMRSVREKFDPGAVTPLSILGTPMLRRGEQGGSGELLSHKKQLRMDGCFREALEELDSDFDWERCCSAPEPAPKPALESCGPGSASR
jgi:hypothetical protein